MKIVDAQWELRNLGVTTQEVEIEASDSMEDICAHLNELTASYQVVKIPCARVDVYSALAKMGFIFVESIIKVSYELKELTSPRLISRLSRELSFDEMTEADIALMNEQIHGGMFQTDRVILDPYFSGEQAANRYCNWMQDELKRGSRLYNYKYKNEPIGFSCMKETRPQVFYPVLGGVYNHGRALPLGSVILYKQLEIAKSLGGKTLYTFISSNNAAVVKIYSQCGYVFDEIKYVFVRHVN